MTLDNIYEEADIKEHLKNYKKIIKFNKIKRDSYIKYFTHVRDNKYNYNSGGYLKYNYDDYIILHKNKTSWSVQKKNNVFYIRVYVDENNLQNKIDNNNKILRKLNQKIMIKTNNLDNNDIFAKLSKPKKVSSNVIGELKDKFNLDNWIFTQVDDLTIGTLIKYIDLNKKSISEECFIKEIIYNTNKTIKTIKVVIRNTELEKKSKYYWKINPQKYYIFKHPNSMMIAFTDML